ncbi:MAG: glycoside hydrolase domain-containing protein [Promethearchaeota archaeon]
MGMDLRSNDVGEASLIFSIILGLFMSLVIIKKATRAHNIYAHLIRILSFIQLILWIIFIFSPWGPFQSYLDPGTAMGIIRGFWVWSNPLIFFMLGVNSIILLNFTLNEFINYRSLLRKSNSNYLFFGSLLIFIFFASHQYLSKWNMDLYIALLSSFLLLVKYPLSGYSTAVTLSWDTFQKNLETILNDNAKEKVNGNNKVVSKLENVVPLHSYPLFQFFLFIMFLLIPIGIQVNTLPMMNYLQYKLTFELYFLGFLIITGLYAIFQWRFSKWIVKNIPWWAILESVLIGLIILTYDLSTRFIINDSSYQNNPVYLNGLIISGILFGGLLISLDMAILQARYLDPTNKKELRKISMKKLIIRTKLHYHGRFLIIAAISGSWIYGLRWLAEQTNRFFYRDGLNLTRDVLWGFCILLLIGLLVHARLKRPMTKLKAIIKNSKTIKKEINHERENKKLKVEINKRVITNWLFAALFLLLILIPTFFPNNFFISSAKKYNSSILNQREQDNEFIPPSSRYLGALGDSSFTEVSPMIKVDKIMRFNNPFFRKSNTTIIAGNYPIIRRSMARNEFESVQIVISNYGLKTMRVLNVSIKSKNGTPSAFSRVPIVRSWKGSPWKWNRFSAYYIEDSQPGYPNILYPFVGNISKVKLVENQNETRPAPLVNPGQSLSLWLTLYAGEDLISSNYSDIISIETDRGVFQAELRSHVWNFTLPVNHSFRTAIGCSSSSLVNRDEWNRNFLQHRVSPYFVYNFSSLFTRNGTNYTFNFTDFEKDLENAINFGLDSFAIMYAPASIKEGAFTQEFNESTINFYRPLAQFLKNHTLSGGGGKTWLDLAYVYAIDEPEESFYPVCNEWASLIHQADPGWHVLLTEQVEPELEGSVDIWVPIMNSFNVSNIPIQHAKDKEEWFYTCCHLTHQPTISYIDPAADNRALTWTAFAHDFDGYLYWSANAYITAPRYDKYWVGFDNIGGSALVLSDQDNHPVNTLVWETLRDALEDIEYFNLLKTHQPNSELITEIQTLWSDFHEYPRDSGAYFTIREQAGNILSNEL